MIVCVNKQLNGIFVELKQSNSVFQPVLHRMSSPEKILSETS
jgi:hypothetical protein